MSVLSAAGVSVRLGDKTVLDNVSAVFSPGAVTTIIGANGAGKSTLLSCLAGLRKPDQGQVKLEEGDLLALPARDRAQRIGYLPQIPEVAWSISVRTLVALGRVPFTGARGLTAADDAAVDAALTDSNAAALAGRSVATLSGGERARVLLARALAGTPRWLLADEPLAGLDPAHQLDAGALFHRLAQKGCGVILTLHDLHMALRISDRVLVLGEGRIIADGTPATALAPEVLARAYGVTARIWDGTAGPLIEIIGRQ